VSQTVNAAAAAEPYNPLAGHVGHLTEQQDQVLAAFKALLFAQGMYRPEPPTFDDVTLLRFLRARRWDPQAALKQLQEAKEWKKQCHVEEFFRTHNIDTYDEARRVYPCWTGRRTKTGVPVFIYRVCDLDKKTMARFFDHSNNQKAAAAASNDPPSVVALYESLQQLVVPLCDKLKDRPHPETPIAASCNIIDITGVTLMQFFSLRGHLADASTLATARYPETLDSVLVVGAPPYMDTVFSFISQFFDERMRAKIKIMGSASDQKATLEAMKEIIDTENIPAAYGGTLDWKFGEAPNLDPVIMEKFDMTGIKNSRDWPKGPVRLDGDEIVAVGTTSTGEKRREVLGTYRGTANGH